MSWKKLEIPDKHILSMTSEFQFNCRWKLTLMTGFLITGYWKWYIMVFFWTNPVWRVFWYPFCVPYTKFSIFGILISAVGGDQPRSTLIPEDQWFVMIKNRFYQKIGNTKLYIFFYSRKRDFFSEKQQFFSIKKNTPKYTSPFFDKRCIMTWHISNMKE